MTEELTKETIEGRTKTQVVINLANTIDYADAQIDVAVYNPVEVEFGLSTTQLGAITAVRAVLQAIFTPFWGIMSDKYSRKKILAFGSFLWGVVTILVGSSQSYNQMLLARGINGIALAIITPVTYSLIADYFKPESRGKAFGLLGLTSVLGAVLGTLYATTISGSPIFGFDGWRFAYYSFGATSILLGFLVLLFAKDPIRGGTEKGFENVGIDTTTYQISSDHVKTILTNRTFIVIVAQGMVGFLPWSALGFMILFMQYVGVDDFTAALAYGIIAIGAALGNLFGGFAGDWANQRSPIKGRLYVALISIFSGIPLSYVIFQLIPRNPSSLGLYIGIGMITGFMISWVAPAANNPILGEIIEPEARSTAYSIQRLFEGSFAAFGTVIVGWLAENIFGYIDRTGKISELPESVRINNVDALANSIFWVLVVGWSLCFIIYTLTLRTYPADKERITEVMEKRAAHKS